MYKTYNASVPSEERIDAVVKWLSDPQGPQMISVYASESPDTEGHRYGPDSAEVTAAIEKCDRMVGRLLSQLDELGLRDRVDVIITSDHGMSNVFPDNQTIFLEDFDLDFDSVDVIYPNIRSSPDVMLTLRPRFDERSTDTERAEQEYKATKLAWKALNGKHLNMSMYHKERIWHDESGRGNGKGGRILERLHYNDNDRIMPLIAVADTGFLLAGTRNNTLTYDMRGTHGYDPINREMHPIFLATGPSFRRGAAFEAFPNVNIYPLLCSLLGIKPARNSGHLKAVAGMLAPCAPLCAPPDTDGMTDDDVGGGGAATEAVMSSGSGRTAAGFVGFLIGVGVACIVAFVLRKTGRLRFGVSQPYVAVSDGSTMGYDYGDVELSKQ